MTQLTVFHPTPGESAGAGQPRLRVVIAYDRPAAAQRALSLVRRLAREADREMEVHPELWRFDVIESPVTPSAVGPSTANLLVVTTDGEQDLSPAVKRWVSTWASATEPSSGAMVALYHREGSDCTGATSGSGFLRQTAKDHGHAFICNCAGQSESPAPVESSHPRARSGAGSKQQRRIRPVQRWGLNE